MKKTMIFAIILLPIIILGVVFLSGRIINFSTYVYVERIEFVEDEIVLDKPDENDVSALLEVNVYPQLANNKDLNFHSENPDIISVDEDGKVTGHGFGETYVWATSKENETKKAMCLVKVTSDHVHSISADNPVSKMYVGDEHQLDIKCIPSEAKDVELVAQSSNPQVVYASDDGHLIAKSKGEATISISLKNNPDVKYSFDVTVKVRAEHIYIDDASTEESGLSQFDFPTVKFAPSEAIEKLSYYSSDDTIATVDSTGHITFLKAGTVTIFAEAEGVEGKVEKTYYSTGGYFNQVMFENTNPRVVRYEDYQGRNLELVWKALPINGNAEYISFESSNSSVIRVENGQLKVVGGGIATITIYAKTSEDNSIHADWTVEVQRNIDEIKFNIPDFLISNERVIDLGTTFLPVDARGEVIEYEVSDNNLAQIQNGRLTFSAGVISNKFGKVTVKAKTQNGVEKSAVIAYVDKDIQKINYTGQESLDFTLAKTGEDTVIFALIVNGDDVKDVNYVVTDRNVLSQNGFIFTPINKGTTTIDIYLNGELTARLAIEVNVKREVERINNVKVTATWDGLESKEYEGVTSIYSSSKDFQFSYNLMPENTTLDVANIEVIGDSAIVDNGVVKFVKAGKVTVKLTADDVEVSIEIESTFLHPDSTTTVSETLNIEKGNSLSIYDKISISPQGASKQYITFQAVGDAITIDENGEIHGVHGGNATIIVNIATATENIQKTISVYVKETASNVEVVGSKYIFVEGDTFDLNGKFTVFPATANDGTTLTYGVEGDGARINAQNIVQFTKAGRFVVWARLENNEIARISLVYTNDAIVVEGDGNILTGTKFIIKPSSEVLANADYDTVFVSSDGNATITNDIFVTISGNTTISFGGATYNFVCVGKMSSATISPTNSKDVDVDGTNITGLTTLPFTGNVLGVDEQYIIKNYESQNTQVATISESGILTFLKAGEVTIKMRVEYKNVIGAENERLECSYTIQSTFGKILSVTVNGVANQFVIDDANEVNNILNLADKIQVFPSQIEINSQNIQIGSSNNDIASVSGFNVTFNKGGNVTISIRTKSGDSFVLAKEINFEVKKNAEGILLDGEQLSDGDVIEKNKASIFVYPKAYPLDANQNNEITWDVVENNGVAEIDKDNNRIKFNKANEQIKVKFTLGSGESSKEIYVFFKTLTITREIYVEDEVLIVPVDEAFTFASIHDEISDLVVDFGTAFGTVQEENGRYLITSSAVGDISLSYGGNSYTKRLIVTSGLQKIENVSITDVDMNGISQDISIDSNDVFVTASKNVKVNYIIPTGFDKFGEQLTYVISTNNSSVATVSGNQIVFSKAGDVEVTITISYEDAYGTQTITFKFTIQSTFGKVSKFAISQSEYSFIADEMTEADKTIDIISTLTRLAPLYGTVDAPELSVENTSIATATANNIQVCGSGNTKIVVVWGNQTERVSLTVDKYIDGIEFVADDEVVKQIVTKNDSYSINYSFIVDDSAFAPTKKDIEYTVSGNGHMEGNSLVFDGNGKVVVTASAKDGTASAQLILIKVDEDVNIISANQNTSSIVIEAGKTNVFNFNFGEEIVWLDSVVSGDAVIADTTLGLFSAEHGTSGKLVLTNNQEITYVVTEEVVRIDFASDAIADGLVMGASTLDIATAYGATIYPSTARDANGAYELGISVDSNIATIKNGVLTFTSAGVVTLTFSAGGITASRTIESTVGLAKSVEFTDNNRITLEYVDGTYVVSNDSYTIYPSDATNANITLSSSNNDVFTVNGNELTLAGGGLANLVLSYASVNGQKSISKEMLVINRATGIQFLDGGNETGYIVKNAQNKQTMILAYNILSNGTMSDHYIEFISSNTDVATISDEGVITFLGNGKTTITVRVRDNTNGEDDFDAESTLTLINKTSHDILSFEDNKRFVVESDSKNILYPITKGYMTAFDFTVESGRDVLEIGEDGEITEKAGGEAVILIKDKNSDWSKRVTIYIHKTAQIVLSKSSILTVSDTCNVGATFTPSDALLNKDIEYVSSNTNIATVSDDGVVSFTEAGIVEITVKILYNGQVEDEKKMTIQSTKGKVSSFDIENSSCTVYVGESQTFTVKNILPTDFSGELEVVSQSDAVSVSISGNNITVTGLSRADSGIISIRFAGSEAVVRTISVVVKQRPESITFKQNGTTITEIKSFSNTVPLSISVTPSNANDTSVTWSVVSGNVTVVNGVVTFISGSYGTAVVKATANDGGCNNTITIHYMQDISDFTISRSSKEISNGATTGLDYNQNSLTLQIKIIPANLEGFDFLSKFTVSSSNGSTVGSLDSEGFVTITTPSDKNFLEFEDTITISYDGKIVKTVKIYRDGIESVDFGDHSAKKDLLCGLQEARVFGNESFYDGAIQPYYKMEFNVTPASRADGISWTSDKGSAVSFVQEDGYVKIWLNAVSVSTFDEVYADNFDNGAVTVYATNKIGEVLCSYTFHMVQGVNVWDQDGYVNGSGTIVLQKSLGHDDQADEIAAGTVSRLEAYAEKDVIYGNGHLLNYAWENANGEVSSGGSSITGGKWSYITVKIQKMVNLKLQGANNSEDRTDYLLNCRCFDNGQTAYCEIFNMYRAVELGADETISIRKTLFHTFAHSAISLSNTGSRKVYLTDVIMFDVGYRAIESQSATDEIYISGFFDVYNFQNSSTLAIALGNKESYAEQVISEASKEGLTVDANGDTWANVVIIATKQTDKNSDKTKVYYVSEDGTTTLNGVPGVEQLTVQVTLTSLGWTKYEYAAWVTNDVSWSNEYNTDGSFNELYMISTSKKLERTYSGE